MEKVGGIIYSYRKISKLSQEELAGIVGVSPAAVSKWERNISVPDVEILCRLADYFGITVDEILGRYADIPVDIKFDSQAEADRFFVASELLECCAIARSTGLLAVEEHVKKKEGSVYDFLKFAVRFLLEGLFQKHMPYEDVRELLLQYAKNERDPRTAEMVGEGIVRIASGENEEILREVLRSFLGRKYARLFATQEQEKRWRLGREEMIQYYSGVSVNVSDTGLLDEIEQAGDHDLQRILRELTDTEFVRAAAGASAQVRRRLFRNLSDRMIWMLGEALVNFSEGLEEVEDAQRKILGKKLGIEISV